MNVNEVIEQLKEKSDILHLEGMKRFGIDNSKALGVSMPKVRQLAKEIKKDQALSLGLWETGIHDCMLENAPRSSESESGYPTTNGLVGGWLQSYGSGEARFTATHVCSWTTYAIEKAIEYSLSEKEYIKRAGFVLMAEFVAHEH